MLSSPEEVGSRWFLMARVSVTNTKAINILVCVHLCPHFKDVLS